MEDFDKVGIQRALEKLEQKDFDSLKEMLIVAIDRRLALNNPSDIDQCIAAKNWLEKHKVKPNATKSDKRQGYVEALYHCSELKDFEEVSEIFQELARDY